MTSPAVRVDPEFKRLIAPLLEDERAQLEANIEAEGCRDALVAWNGILLDGYNRFEICSRLKKPYRVTAIRLPDRVAARIWVRWNQLGRRNLTDDQRTAQIVDLLEDLTAQSKHQRASTAVDAREKKAGRRPILSAAVADKIKARKDTRHEVSKRAKISERKIKKAQALKKRRPELLKQVAAGDISLNEAVRQTKPDIRAEKLAEAIWPEGKYGVILSDSPWKPDEGLLDPTRAIENHYPTLDLAGLIDLRPRLEALALPDCVLLLWTPSQKLAEAAALIQAWGFVVKSGAVWVKPSIGMGYWFRSRHELLVLATRGNPLTPLEADRPDSVIQAPRGRHSEKPDEIYTLIERMFPTVPKVEMFARAARPGWAHSTNEPALRTA